MGKGLLYASNSNTQALAVGETINFGMPVRRYGCYIDMSGGNVVIDGSGYYTDTINITFTANGTGLATFTIYKDGIAVPGATCSITVANGNVYNIVIPCVVKQKCECESTIVVAISGVALTISNAAVEVIKE